MSSATQSPNSSETTQPARRNAIFLWAVGGVVLLLTQAVIRLTEVSLEALGSGLMSRTQWIVCGLWIVANCYMEGHRGFHKKFVPRVVARAHYLALNPKTSLVVVAPLFAMAYFSATKRGKGAAWGVTTLVILAIWAVRSLDQPTRGIIDAGVVAGLGWGMASLLVATIARLRGETPPGDPELSEDLLIAQPLNSSAAEQLSSSEFNS